MAHIQIPRDISVAHSLYLAHDQHCLVSLGELAQRFVDQLILFPRFNVGVGIVVTEDSRDRIALWQGADAFLAAKGVVGEIAGDAVQPALECRGDAG